MSSSFKPEDFAAALRKGPENRPIPSVEMPIDILP
jgi:hypothetical protein